MSAEGRDQTVCGDYPAPCNHDVPHVLGSSCPFCDLPQRWMRDFVAHCDNGHAWDRRRLSDDARSQS